MLHTSDTIAAISTPAGIGGIAVIRISGPKAIEVASRHFTPSRQGHDLGDRSSHTLTFGQIAQPSGEVLDEVVTSLYRAPHSFTGEDVVEISCHGSMYVQQTLLQLITSDADCRMAEPGEFTRRAFQNGRLDLSQAEAVADLIASTNAASHRLAVNQLKGTFSRKLSMLRSQLLDLNSLLELELDFSEEDVEFADRQRLTQLASQIQHEVGSLADTFHTGQAIRNGIPVAIIGETNAGKSTLLNQLLGDERAIVSDVHGTTRDVIEDTCLLDGVLLRFIDTAGIRTTTDRVEAMGIERTYQRLSQADIVLWMIDGTRLGDASLTQQLADDAASLYRQISAHLRPEQHLLILLNKVDLVSKAALVNNLPSLQGTLNRVIDHSTPRYIILSAKHEQGIEQLREALHEVTRLPESQAGDVIVSNVRHFQALRAADMAISRVIDGLSSGLSGDLIAEDLKDCSFHLGSIVGEVSTDEVLGNIFSKFCIGK